MNKLTSEQINAAKGRGFLLNRESGRFSSRTFSGNGVYTSAQLRALADCADQYGNGTATVTTRMAVELPGIAYEDMDDAERSVNEAGMVIGGTGPKIRPVTACKGTTCVYGNCDTQGLARELHERFYLGWRGVVLPHKFKIGVGGCPNSCVKPSLNDLGIEARCDVRRDDALCRSCKVCFVVERCPMRAVERIDGKIVVTGECNSCGVCTRACPFGAFASSGEPRFRIYLGGMWGKKTRNGTPLDRYIPRDELFDIVEMTLLWYKANAFRRERMGAAIDRVGLSGFDRSLLARKDEILAAPLLERGQ